MGQECEEEFYYDLTSPIIELDDLLLIQAVSFDDFNQSDMLAECERMMLCNRYIQNYYDSILSGTLQYGDIEVLGDVLAESGLDPYIWAYNWQNNLKKIVTSGLPYEL
jgi:hypothetical protein